MVCTDDRNKKHEEKPKLCICIHRISHPVKQSLPQLNAEDLSWSRICVLLTLRTWTVVIEWEESWQSFLVTHLLQKREADFHKKMERQFMLSFCNLEFMLSFCNLSAALCVFNRQVMTQWRGTQTSIWPPRTCGSWATTRSLRRATWASALVRGHRGKTHRSRWSWCISLLR